MKIKEVSISLGETFGKRRTKYETFRVDIGYSATLEEGESEAVVRTELIKKAKLELELVKSKLHKEE
jgi:hypothetical protein